MKTLLALSLIFIFTGCGKQTDTAPVLAIPKSASKVNPIFQTTETYDNCVETYPHLNSACQAIFDYCDTAPTDDADCEHFLTSSNPS